MSDHPIKHSTAWLYGKQKLCVRNGLIPYSIFGWGSASTSNHFGQQVLLLSWHLSFRAISCASSLRVCITCLSHPTETCGSFALYFYRRAPWSCHVLRRGGSAFLKYAIQDIENRNVFLPVSVPPLYRFFPLTMKYIAKRWWKPRRFRVKEPFSQGKARQNLLLPALQHARKVLTQCYDGFHDQIDTPNERFEQKQLPHYLVSAWPFLTWISRSQSDQLRVKKLTAPLCRRGGAHPLAPRTLNDAGNHSTYGKFRQNFYAHTQVVGVVVNEAQITIYGQYILRLHQVL